MSRMQRERVLSRLVIAALALVMVGVVALLGVGYWREVLHKGEQPIAIVNGQPIPLLTFAKVRAYRVSQLDQAIYQTQVSISYLQSQPKATPTPGSAGSPTPAPSSQATPSAGATPAATPDTNEQMIQQLQQQLQSLQLQRQSVDSEVLENMINNELYRQEAARRGLVVKPEEIDAEIEKEFGAPTPVATREPQTPTAAAQATGTAAPAAGTPTAGQAGAASSATPVPTQTPKPAPSPAATSSEKPGSQLTPTGEAAQAAATPTPVDAKQKLEDYLGQTNLLTVAEYRQLIVEPMLLEQKLRDAIGAEVPKTAEQVRARHILVSTEEDAKKVLDRLNKGETFEKVAAEVSQDTSNKDKGGELGWFTRGVMDPDFEKAAFSLPVGKISDPVKTSYGYHIIQVEEHEQNRPLSADQLSQAQSRAFEEWLTGKKAAVGAIQRLDTSDNLLWADRWYQDRLKAEPPR